jgi:hypothetical protein
MLMKNSDPGKHGSLMTSLRDQLSMKTEQYPKDILAAANILTNHKFNKREPKSNSQKEQELEQQQHTALTITILKVVSTKRH